MVTRLVGQYGPKRWSLIASNLPGRTGQQCRKRWRKQLLRRAVAAAAAGSGSGDFEDRPPPPPACCFPHPSSNAQARTPAAAAPA